MAIQVLKDLDYRMHNGYTSSPQTFCLFFKAILLFSFEAEVGLEKFTVNILLYILY